jgi:hypothetical protein
MTPKNWGLCCYREPYAKLQAGARAGVSDRFGQGYGHAGSDWEETARSKLRKIAPRMQGGLEAPLYAF